MNAAGVGAALCLGALVAVAGCSDDEAFSDPEFELMDIVPFDAAAYGSKADGAGGDADPLPEQDSAAGGKDSKAVPDPVVSFATAYGGSFTEELEAVVRKGKDIYVAGFTGSFGAGGNDALAMRVDACGKVQWVKAYGGPGDDEAVAIAPVGAQLWLAGATTVADKGQQAWLFRIGEGGAMSVSVALGGPGTDKAAAMVATPGGGAVAVVNTDSYGPGAPKRDSLAVVGVDAKAKLLWSRVYGGKYENNVGVAIAALPGGGGYAVAGSVETWGAGKDDLWLLRLDPLGKFHWSRAYGSEEDDEARAIIIAPDGGFLLAGFTAGFGAKGDDMVVLKVNGGGVAQWLRRVGGAGDERAYAATRSGTGYLIGGTSDSFGGGDEAAMVRLGPGGDIVWGQRIGGKKSESLRAVVADTDGSTLGAGYTRSIGAGQYDAWLMRTEATATPGCSAEAIAALELGSVAAKPTVTTVKTTSQGEVQGASFSATTTEASAKWSAQSMCAGSKCL